MKEKNDVSFVFFYPIQERVSDLYFYKIQRSFTWIFFFEWNLFTQIFSLFHHIELREKRELLNGNSLLSSVTKYFFTVRSKQTIFFFYFDSSTHKRTFSSLIVTNNDLIADARYIRRVRQNSGSKLQNGEKNIQKSTRIFQHCPTFFSSSLPIIHYKALMSASIPMRSAHVSFFLQGDITYYFYLLGYYNQL